MLFMQLGIGIGSANANVFNHCDSSNFTLPSELSLAYSATFGDAPGPPIETFATVAALKAGWTPGLNYYETPIAVRFTHLIDVMHWNCAAAYSAGWKDALTKVDPVVRVPAVPSNMQLIADGVVDMYTSDKRYLCMVSASATVVQDWAPESYTSLNGVLSNLGFTNLRYGYDADVEEIYNGWTSQVSRDIELNVLAEANCYSPQIMGAIIGRQMTEYATK